VKQEYPARMSEQQRAQLFELWKRAPFPEIASAVDSFMQGVAAQASRPSEVRDGVDGCAANYIYSGGAGTRGQ